jgi:hypothetical protein
MSVCMLKKELSFLVSSFFLPRLVPQMLNAVITMLLRLFELKGLIRFRLDKTGHLVKLVFLFLFIYLICFFFKGFELEVLLVRMAGDGGFPGDRVGDLLSEIIVAKGVVSWDVVHVGDIVCGAEELPECC